MMPRSRTVDDGHMADPANVTWSSILVSMESLYVTSY